MFGPRGTGKSTWLRTVLPHAHTVNLLDEALYQSYLADVSLFAAELRALRPGSMVVVDEIQRLPDLLNEVHRLLEERRLRFVLCVSSARKLKQSGTNLLAGRAIRREMVAIEVRAGRTFSEPAARGLKAVADLRGVVRRVFVCRGDRVLRTADGIDVLPIQRIVRELEEQTLFP